LGYASFDDLAGRNLEIDGLHAAYYREQFKRILDAQEEIRGVESVWRRRDGSTVFIRENAKLVRGPQDEVFYDGTIEDITERRMAEEQLRESREQYRHIVDFATDIVYRSDHQGNFLFFNASGLARMGYTEEEMIGRNYLEFIAPDCVEAVGAFYRNQLITRTPTTYFEFAILSKS